MAAVFGYLALAFAASFLLGSIPWGVVVSRLAFHKDLRDEGSGNIGTTNAMRALGKAGGAAVFVLDFGKGLLSGWLGTLVVPPVLAAARVAGGEGPFPDAVADDCAALVMALVFAGCTLGHVFSPWLRFKGGKGIAVAAACLVFVFGPVGFLAEIAVFAMGVLLTRHVSVGSIAAAVVCPVLALYYYWGHWLSWLVITLTALVVVWAHRSNIRRLREGTESTIGRKK